MMDVYKPPESKLEHDLEGTNARPHGFWKFFFWLHVVIFPMLLLLFFVGDSVELTVFDYVDVLMLVLIIIALYDYAYAKKMISARVYSVLFYVYVLWSVFYLVIAPFVLNIPTYGEVTDVDIFLAIEPFFVFPLYYCLYRLKQRSG